MIKEIPPCIPRTHSHIGKWLGTLILKLAGWKVTGQFPQTGKFVAAVAPHTSNWDFVIAIAVKLSLNIEIRFLGKHSIFVGPLGWLLRKWGGIAVERSAPHGVVGQVKELFEQSDALILGIAPEGTRKWTTQWKSGFLHMAKSANVPVVPMALDYRHKEFVIMPPESVGEDIETELERFKGLYQKEMAKYPHQMSGC